MPGCAVRSLLRAILDCAAFDGRRVSPLDCLGGGGLVAPGQHHVVRLFTGGIARLPECADEMRFTGAPPHRSEQDMPREFGGDLFEDKLGPVVIGQRAYTHEAFGIFGGHKVGHAQWRARALRPHGDEVVRAVFVESIDAQLNAARIETFLPDLVGIVIVSDGKRGFLEPCLSQPERHHRLFIVAHYRYHHRDIHIEGPVFRGKYRSLFRGDEGPDGFVVKRGQFIDI
ncbi:MAG: hypothetical protein ACOX5J_09610 [Candidatus Hydrogenedentales bacterium]